MGWKMYAAIKNHLATNGVYFSEVFAMYKNGIKSKVVVFDFTEQTLVSKDVYRVVDGVIERGIFVLNMHTDFWQKTDEQYSCYGFLGNAKKLFEHIENGRNISFFSLRKCQKIQEKLEVLDIQKIEDEYDLDCVFDLASNFKNATLIKPQNVGSQFANLTDLTLEVQCDFDVSLRLIFTGSVSGNLGFLEQNFINCASIFFEEGFIYFVANENDFVSAKQFSINTVFIKAEKISWKYKIN